MGVEGKEEEEEEKQNKIHENFEETARKHQNNSSNIEKKLWKKL